MKSGFKDGYYWARYAQSPEDPPGFRSTPFIIERVGNRWLTTGTSDDFVCDGAPPGYELLGPAFVSPPSTPGPGENTEPAFPSSLVPQSVDLLRKILAGASDRDLVDFLNGYAVGAIIERLLEQLGDRPRSALVAQLREAHPEWFEEGKRTA